MNLLLFASFLIFLMMFIYYLTEKDKSKRIIKDSEVSKSMEKEKDEDEIPDDVEESKKLVKKRREREIKHEKTEDFYKNGMTILAVVTAILLLWQVIIPIFVHGSIDVTLGGKDIELNSDKTGKWEIILCNHGFVSSKNIILRVRFDKYVEIDYDTMFCNPSPDNKKIEDEYEIEYVWNNLDSGQDNIHLRIDVRSPYPLIGKTRAFVEVRAEGEGLVYSYYGYS